RPPSTSTRTCRRTGSLARPAMSPAYRSGRPPFTPSPRRGHQLVHREAVGMVVVVRANDERRYHQIVRAGLVDVFAGLRDRHLDLVGERSRAETRLMDQRRALCLRVAQQARALEL